MITRIVVAASFLTLMTVGTAHAQEMADMMTQQKMDDCKMHLDMAKKAMQ